MGKTGKTWPKKLLAGIIILSLTLWAVLLALMFFSKNVTVISSRTDSDVTAITDYTVEEKEQDGTPLGVVEEYVFTLPESISHDTSLNFFLVHQYAAVYLDGECIYELKPSGSLPMIRTVGSNSVSIPIYRSEAGKQVRVVLTPVYQDIRSREVAFTLGSSAAVVRSQINTTIGGFFSCFFLLICGGAMILHSVFRRKKDYITVSGLCYGFVIVALGLWKCFDFPATMYLLPGKTVFEYYLSISMLMISMLPVMGIPGRKTRWPYPQIYVAAVAVLSLASGLLQLFGLADLRVFLKLIQASVIVGVLLLCFRLGVWRKENRSNRLSFIACIFMVASAILDVILYYVSNDSVLSFVTIIMLVSASIFMVFYNMENYERQLLEVEKQKELVVKNRVEAMMGQIRSHFIFNILNAISGMCKYDPQKADRTIVCFARYLRTNIDIMQEDEPVPFRTALAHFEDYMELERIRFGDMIRYEEQIETDRFRIPLLLIQPLAENAVKHGLRARPEGGTVTLSTRLEGDTVLVSVKDDGVGYTPGTERKNSVGLSNVRDRLQYMVGGRLEIESEPGRGTTATIILPASAVLMEEEEN